MTRRPCDRIAHYRTTSRRSGATTAMLWPLFALLTAVALVSGCGPAAPVKESTPVAIVDPALEALNLGEFQRAAETFSAQAAAMAPGPEREMLRLRAIDAYLDAGAVDAAMFEFASLVDPSGSADSGPVLRAAYRATAARLAIADARLVDAERLLENFPPTDLEGRFARTYWVARVGLAEARQSASDSLFARLNLEPTLTPADPLRFGNTEGTWRALKQLDDAALVALRARMTESLAGSTEAARTASNALLEGWTVLLRTYRLDRADLEVLRGALQGFAARYPMHPAHPALTEQILAEAAALKERPSRIALLLPLSSPELGDLAEAIRDGLVSAYLDESNPDAQPSLIRVYDLAAQNEGVLASYARAIEEGAEFVIGPLTRENIQTLVGKGELVVPTLALNRIEEAGAAANLDNLFQFGLPPEDEAIAVAENAWSFGYRRALTMAPIDPWGQRVLEAFSTRFRALGGHIQATERFQDDGPAYAPAVARVLGVDESRERARQLESMLGVNLEFRPRPRDDADFLFIAARPVEARQLMPQVRYYGAQNLPVLATSHVFSGRDADRVDPDLAGLHFVDMPWLLHRYETRASLSFDRVFDTRYATRRRLFALGADAYLLATEANRLRATPNADVAGLSGRLSVRPDGVIRRAPAWGSFPSTSDGAPEPGQDGFAPGPGAPLSLAQ